MSNYNRFFYRYFTTVHLRVKDNFHYDIFMYHQFYYQRKDSSIINIYGPFLIDSIRITTIMCFCNAAGIATLKQRGFVSAGLWHGKY